MRREDRDRERRAAGAALYTMAMLCAISAWAICNIQAPYTLAVGMGACAIALVCVARVVLAYEI